MPSFSKTAGGNIEPLHFVTLSTTSDGVVTQAGAGAKIYGVSGPTVRNAPYASLDDGYHAISGEDCLVYGPPEKDVVVVAGGTIAAFDRLKSDANGEAVATTTNLDEYGAIAMESGTAGKMIRVQLVPPTQISS